MENTKPEFENLAEGIKEYVHTSMDLYKLMATEKGAEIASSVTINLILVLIATLILLFASVAAALLIAEVVGKIYLGFAIIAAFYALIGVFIFLTKDKWLKGPIMDNIIRAVYN